MAISGRTRTDWRESRGQDRRPSPAPFPAILISIAPIINGADQVPKFDLRSICESNEGCVRDETAARNQLAEQWSQFPAVERARCVRLTTSSKMPSSRVGNRSRDRELAAAVASGGLRGRAASCTRAVHSITSSARASSVGGTVIPSIRAVCALITSSNLVDCATGRSAGLAPLRMRPA